MKPGMESSLAGLEGNVSFQLHNEEVIFFVIQKNMFHVIQKPKTCKI